MRDSLKHILS
jgi:dynein heavy chain